MHQGGDHLSVLCAHYWPRDRARPLDNGFVPRKTGCPLSANFNLLCSSGSSPGSHRPVLEAHPGANTFPSVCGLTTTSFTDPSASRNTFSVSTITDGNAQAGAAAHLPPLRWPNCTSSRLFALVAEEDDRLVTQSIAIPEPGCPDPHPRSSRSLRVSPHSGADGLVQGELPPTT